MVRSEILRGRFLAFLCLCMQVLKKCENVVFGALEVAELVSSTEYWYEAEFVVENCYEICVFVPDKVKTL